MTCALTTPLDGETTNGVHVQWRSAFSVVRIRVLQSVSCSLCRAVYVRQSVSAGLCQAICVMQSASGSLWHAVSVRQTVSGLREVLDTGPAFIAAYPSVCARSFVGWFRI